MGQAAQARGQGQSKAPSRMKCRKAAGNIVTLAIAMVVVVVDVIMMMTMMMIFGGAPRRTAGR